MHHIHCNLVRSEDVDDDDEDEDVDDNVAWTSDIEAEIETEIEAAIAAEEEEAEATSDNNQARVIHQDLNDLVDEDYVITSQDRVLESTAPKKQKFVTLLEFRAFLGLWMLRGLWSQANSKLDHLYLPDSIPIFGAVMSRERYSIHYYKQNDRITLQRKLVLNLVLISEIIINFLDHLALISNISANIAN